MVVCLTLPPSLSQTAFFFGYMLMASVSVALLCGASGFVAAYFFVKVIYRNVKLD